MLMGKSHPSNRTRCVYASENPYMCGSTHSRQKRLESSKKIRLSVIFQDKLTPSGFEVVFIGL